MRRWLIFITCCVVIVAVYIFGIKTGQQIAVKTDKPVAKLAQPNMSREAILVWANEAALAVMSYDFANLEQQLQQAAEYFTPDGWKSYMAAFKQAGTLDMVINKKLTVSAVATGAAKILDQGIVADKYTWKVQLPMLVTYTGANTATKQNLLVTMTIVRTAEGLDKRGVGILDFSSATKTSS
jgi:intracellular multiplication protein IcmL